MAGNDKLLFFLRPYANILNVEVVLSILGLDKNRCEISLKNPSKRNPVVGYLTGNLIDLVFIQALALTS